MVKGGFLFVLNLFSVGSYPHPLSNCLDWLGNQPITPCLELRQVPTHNR